jgi:hypothetical protein
VIRLPKQDRPKQLSDQNHRNDYGPLLWNVSVIHLVLFGVAVVLIWLVRGRSNALPEEFSEKYLGRNIVVTFLVFGAIVAAFICVNNSGNP